MSGIGAVFRNGKLLKWLLPLCFACWLFQKLAYSIMGLSITIMPEEAAYAEPTLTTATTATLALLVIIGIQVFDTWCQLRQAPGPLLASVSDFWRAWYQYRGQLRPKLIELHKKHGSIVRYGIQCISISDPSIIDVVYGSRQGFTTVRFSIFYEISNVTSNYSDQADSYKVLVGISNRKEVASLVSTENERQHAQLRRSIAGAFTQNAALDYEPFVTETISELLQTLSEKSACDLSSMMLYFTMDSAGRFTFGSPLGCLETEADVGGSIQTIRDRFSHWGLWSSLPWLERLIYRNPIAMRSSRAPSSMAAAAISKLKSRLGDEAEGAHSFDLLTKFIEYSHAHPDILDTTGIVGMLMSTISGAGDTTATALTAILYLLFKHPQKLMKLEKELRHAKLDRIPTFKQVSKLPYLHAVVREGMRLFSSPTFPIERRVPLGGATIAGMFFPEGTSVGCLPAALHLNKTVFGDDADQYRPERWLTNDPEELKKLEIAHMGFSRGRRVCLGQHIAMMQMKKVIPALVLSFQVRCSPTEVNKDVLIALVQFTLDDPEAELTQDFSPAAACLKSLPLHINKRNITK